MESSSFAIVDRVITGQEVLDRVPIEHRDIVRDALVGAMNPDFEPFPEPFREILRCLADDLTIAQIAKRMGRAESTIEHHIRQMKDKLGCRGLAGLMAVAMRKKIIE